MEKSLIFNSVFIFMALWGIALFFIWFRPKLEFFWKIAATLVFAFYMYFFFEEVFKGYTAFKADWYTVIMAFLKELIVLLFYINFIFWPIALTYAFYKADDFGSEFLLKFMCVFTLALWITAAIYVYKSKTVDDFFLNRLIKSIPFTGK